MRQAHALNRDEAGGGWFIHTTEGPIHARATVVATGVIDGTSLTVNTVQRNRFTVNLIAHTLAVTTWGQKGAGDRVNMEVDLMARYAARLTEAGSAAA